MTSRYWILAAAAVFVLAGGAPESDADDVISQSTLPPIDSLWDYFDPSGTRTKFEQILPAARKSGDRSYYLQLQTQIARTYGLDGEFDQAHALLDTVEQSLGDAPKIVDVRYLLERGRAYRYGGDPSKSEPLFVKAYELAQEIGADFYAIDAAHMVAVVDTVRADKMKWNLIGVDLAEKTTDERARGWLGSLYNNIGWDYHDNGEYDKALDLFDKALAYRIEQGKPKLTGIAKWSIARTLRSLERYDEALKIQIELRAENDSTGQQDGYVHEELGELYLVLKKPESARKAFAAAYAELSKDDWFAKNESARLERIRTLGKVED
jgi:tetratricopeptide (TPR) repeat protein